MFIERSQECCITSHHAPEETTCFSAEDSSSSSPTSRCLPPLAVLQPEEASPKRCRESAHCGPEHLCVTLGEDIELLRIQVRPSGLNDGEAHEPIVKTIVWSGPRSELLEEGTTAQWTG